MAFTLSMLLLKTVNSLCCAAHTAYPVDLRVFLLEIFLLPSSFLLDLLSERVAPLRSPAWDVKGICLWRRKDG